MSSRYSLIVGLSRDGTSLKELLLQAIRYGDQPEVQARLTTALDLSLARGHLRDLLEEGHSRRMP